MDIIQLALGGTQRPALFENDPIAPTNLLLLALSRNGATRIALYEGRNCFGTPIGIAAICWLDAHNYYRNLWERDRSYNLRLLTVGEAICRGADYVYLVETLIGNNSVGNPISTCTFSLAKT